MVQRLSPPANTLLFQALAVLDKLGRRLAELEADVAFFGICLRKNFVDPEHFKHLSSSSIPWYAKKKITKAYRSRATRKIQDIRGPGPPLEQIAAEPYEMDVKPVQPYQVPVSYMRSLVSQLQATPSDINFFLELGREPNDFLDILDNYQHGISIAIQLGNTLLGLLSLGGVLVVAGRFAGFFGDDDVQEASPLYNAFYTTTLGVTLFAAAVDVLLAFMLYQSSSDLSASINVLPSVKAMAVNDLAAFVKNTVQQKLVIAEREKRHRLEELEEHFHRGFSSYLKARIRKDMKLYEVPSVSDCAESVRQIVEESTSRERTIAMKRLQSDIPDARVKADLKTTLNGLENAAHRLMKYGAKTGWFDRFKSTTSFALLPVLFLMLLAVFITFCIGGMTQHSFTVCPEERSVGSHIAGQALICCSFILFLFSLVALYMAVGLFPYGAVGKYYYDYVNSPEISGHIGNCVPVFTVADKTMGAVCGGFVDSLLAYVFLLVMVAVVSIFLVVMAAKSAKNFRKGKRQVRRRRKKKKGKKKKKKKGSSDTEKSSPSKTPASAPATPVTPPSASSARLSKASEDAVVRITTIRSGDSPTGSIDRSDILEIRIPTPPAPEPPPPPRTPTHTVETVHIKIPPPAQPPPPVAAPPRQKVSTIEIHLPSQYLSQAQVPPPPPRRPAERTVSLIIGGTEGIPVARRSSRNTTMVHVDQASQKRITHHRLNPASWPWSLWYPFWGGGVHETAVRVSSSIELSPVTAIPSMTHLRRVRSGPILYADVVPDCAYGSCT
ncbi:hypothetical protein HPB47_012505 [Ixodes persulcatus]|uniref:Uncharacterized protein n=1 Tax=Ixodes persulcatus TaxID=34615 RepID=A0AC60NTC5_IXOPE|nr:hypothetical protein HPB47_012505 [Ixodes persulcatus]